MYSKRIKWLMQSSRKIFGLIQGDRVGVLVDSSNSNMGFGRAIEFQDSLLVNTKNRLSFINSIYFLEQSNNKQKTILKNLVSEQLSKKKQIYLAAYGSECHELWNDSLKDVHHRT